MLKLVYPEDSTDDDVQNKKAAHPSGVSPTKTLIRRAVPKGRVGCNGLLHRSVCIQLGARNITSSHECLAKALSGVSRFC